MQSCRLGSTISRMHDDIMAYDGLKLGPNLGAQEHQSLLCMAGIWKKNCNLCNSCDSHVTHMYMSHDNCRKEQRVLCCMAQLLHCVKAGKAEWPLPYLGVRFILPVQAGLRTVKCKCMHARDQTPLTPVQACVHVMRMIL